MKRILHLSDLHFCNPAFRLSELFSKRSVGLLNFWFSRRYCLAPSQLSLLPAFAREYSVDTILFTGDASTTGREKELFAAAQLLREIAGERGHILALPGNHDHYTKKDFQRKTFYRYFPSSPGFGKYTLKEHGVEAHLLQEGWFYVGIDTVESTPLYSSQGVFSKKVEQNLRTLLAELPKMPIFLASHFPFFPFDAPRKTLQGGDRLENIIAQDPRIEIYAHGHTHRSCIADLREEGRGLIVDSGSVSLQGQGTFHLYDLLDQEIGIAVYQISAEKITPVRTMRLNRNTFQ